jgi:hypothetical protein
MRAKQWLKWGKRLGIALVALVTLGFLVLAFENYRGRRAWDRYRAESEARGERLDLKSFLPAEVPAEENFAATPLLAPLFEARLDFTQGELIYADSNRVARLLSRFDWLRVTTVRAPGWRGAEFVDLAAWQEALRRETNRVDADLQALQARPPGEPADDLLFLVGRDRDALEELRSAARRPHSYVPRSSYDEQLAVWMPYVARMKGFARVFQIKALAELARGDTDAAAADLQAVLGISATLRREPFLISGLVRLAHLGVIYQPLWEGLARRQWTDPQLARIEAALGQVNLVEEMAFWLRGERAFGLSFFAGQRKGSAGENDGVDSEMAELMRRMPAGWRYQNQVEIARMYDRYVLPVLHPEVPMVDVARNFELERQTKALTVKPYHVYRVLAMQLLPAVQRAALKAAQGQAELHLARVACALERYYLAEGAYPDRLEALAPRFLASVPVDPVNGRPLHYRRLETGRFVLYSLGSDLDDDGGRPAPAKRPPAGVEPDGDWVWRYDVP